MSRWRRGRGQRLRRPRAASGWSRRRPQARARARVGVGTGGRQARAVLGRQRRNLAAAAATLRRRRRLCIRRCARRLRERQNEPMRARASVKIQYFRRSPRRPSDISLCSTAHLTAVGSCRLFFITSNSDPWPSDIKWSSDFSSFTVVGAVRFFRNGGME
jgi:hypothetical protein